MPVRIYEIAKKVGIPSKEVLAKAKELGIANAKVASSTLDKITAEYLEEQIAGKPEPEAPAEEPQAAAEPVIITAPVEEAAPQEAEAAEDSSEETSTEETEPATEEEATEDAEPEAPAEEAEDQAEPAEPAEEEEKDSDLGKKVGFIELGNMPVRPAVRERKKKKDKGKDKQEKKPEKSGTAPEPTTVGGGPRKPKYTAPADGPLIALKPPIIVRDLAEAMKRKPFQLIADLMSLNVFANVNQSIEEPIARDICAKNGFRFRLERRERGAGLVKATTKKKSSSTRKTRRRICSFAPRWSPSWATSTMAKPRCSTSSATRTSPPARRAASPSTLAPTPSMSPTRKTRRSWSRLPSSTHRATPRSVQCVHAEPTSRIS